MYYRRRRGRTPWDASDSHEARRARRQEARRKSERLLLLIIILAPVGLFAAVELGRSLYYMRAVSAFAQRIDQMPAAEVRREVQDFARGLYSPNPLIRNGAMAALKVATGWRLGSDVEEWKRWWAAREATWEYRPAGPTNPPAGADWRQMLPEAPAAAPPAP
jgi:hypothetical protein